MVKTTKYCDICGKIIDYRDKDSYQIKLPTMDSNGRIYLSNTAQDVCYYCFQDLYWKIGQIRAERN